MSVTTKDSTELNWLRSQVSYYTDAPRESGKPLYHDLMRLARSYPGFTGYLNSTPIESWTEEKRLRRWCALKASARRRLAVFEHGSRVTTKRKDRRPPRVTTKTYTRFNPHPKKYASNADRQAAYRRRLAVTTKTATCHK
jgi:hypothetical protein